MLHSALNKFSGLHTFTPLHAHAYLGPKDHNKIETNTNM